MDKMMTLLCQLKEDSGHEYREVIIENIVCDIVSQLDIIDPRDDGDELLEALTAQDNSESLLKTLLGVSDLDEYITDMLEDIDSE